MRAAGGGVSCITNLAAGRSKHPLSHTEVLGNGGAIQARCAGPAKFFARFDETDLNTLIRGGGEGRGCAVAPQISSGAALPTPPGHHRCERGSAG